MHKTNAPITMEIITDPAELAQTRTQREQFDRNAAWLHTHASEIYPKHRGIITLLKAHE